MKRVRVGERMDDPSLAEAEHVAALRALNRTERWLGTYAALWRKIRRTAGRTDSCLDVGSGGGGFLRFLGRRTSAGLLLGVDRSPRALRFSEQNGLPRVLWLAGDARCLPFADGAIDVVVCSLFLHHFDPAAAMHILQEAARVTRRVVVVSDLRRSRAALALTWLGTRMLSRSRVFHVDGPRSVRAAYRPSELRRLAAKAGLSEARVSRVFPFRMILTWKKQGFHGPR